MKHIAFREHFLREKILERLIQPAYSIPSAENPADLFTKALGVARFREHRSRLRIISHSNIRKFTAAEGGQLECILGICRACAQQQMIK